MSQTTEIIRQQNDQFRAGDETIPGRIVFTDTLAAHLQEAKLPMDMAIRQIAAFNGFTEENDPYNEHDFGRFELAGETCYWKIDLYNPEMTAGSEEPDNLAATMRVLTVMLAQDY